MAAKSTGRVSQLDLEIAAMQKILVTYLITRHNHDENFRRLKQERIALRKKMRLLNADQRRTEKTLG